MNSIKKPSNTQTFKYPKCSFIQGKRSKTAYAFQPNAKLRNLHVVSICCLSPYNIISLLGLGIRRGCLISSSVLCSKRWRSSVSLGCEHTWHSAVSCRHILSKCAFNGVYCTRVWKKYCTLIFPCAILNAIISAMVGHITGGSSAVSNVFFFLF